MTHSKNAPFPKPYLAPEDLRSKSGRDTHRQGLQLFKESQFEEAAKWLREALTLEPTAEHWNDWASAELACGRTPQAEAGYRQALTLDLDNGEAALNLGVLCSMSGRAAEALGWLERGMFTADEAGRKLAGQLQAQCRNILAATGAATEVGFAAMDSRSTQHKPAAADPGIGLEGTIDLADGLVLKASREGRFLLPNKDSGISREVIRSGIWAPGDVSLFKRLIEPGQTVVDARANIGHHSVVFSKAAGASGRVVAFEPQAYLFNLLCANLALNGCRNCLPFRMALAETSGTLRIGFLDYETENNFGALCISTTHPGWAVGEEIEIVTLDAFLSSRKLRPHFIKIDVQTFALFVLRGALQTLRDSRPILFIEISPFWMNEVNSYDYREIYGFLRRQGYNLFNKKLERLEQEFERTPNTDRGNGMSSPSTTAGRERWKFGLEPEKIRNRGRLLGLLATARRELHTIQQADHQQDRTPPHIGV